MVNVVAKKPREHFKDPNESAKIRPDVNETAFGIVQAATGQGPRPVPPEERTEADKSATAQERGSKGGKKGGKARAEKLSPEERAGIAKKAADARWENQKPT